jgi:hypothetical protein
MTRGARNSLWPTRRRPTIDRFRRLRKERTVELASEKGLQYCRFQSSDRRFRPQPLCPASLRLLPLTCGTWELRARLKATLTVEALGGRGWDFGLVDLGVAPSAFELCVRWRSRKLDGGLFGGSG